MFGLKLATDPRWVNLAEKSIEDILTDHAYCEQKAASNAISIIQGYHEYDEVIEALMPLVSEEWGHFKMVIDQLKKRNLKLGRQRKDVYVNELWKFVINGRDRNDSLVEKLLFSAMIEARSCERFRLLSKDISDDELKNFYKNLMVSEAGHYRLYIDLASNIWGRDRVNARWEEWLKKEAEIMESIALRGDRMH